MKRLLNFVDPKQKLEIILESKCITLATTPKVPGNKPKNLLLQLHGNVDRKVAGEMLTEIHDVVKALGVLQILLQAAVDPEGYDVAFVDSVENNSM